MTLSTSPAGTPAPSNGAVRPVRPAAVLWDMDGTLINSEPYWMAAETELVEAHGGRWSHEDGLGLVGNALDVSAGVLRSAGVDLGIDEIVDLLVEQVTSQVLGRVPWQAGAYALLGELVAAGIPSALVTMSFRRLADAVVSGAPANTFAAVVCGDEVVHGKPDPEPYLRAAAALGVDVTRCVAVEDSPAGVASALASGARTIGVRVMVPIEPRPGLSRIASLADLDLELLHRVAGGEVVDLLDA